MAAAFRDQAGIALAVADTLERDAEQPRDDLPEGCLVALADRLGPRGQGEVAIVAEPESRPSHPACRRSP